jgi:adenylate cyclase
MNQPTITPVLESVPVACSLDDEAVREELGRVLASSGFASSAKLSSFLRYIVDEALAGRARDIKAYAIALNAFERPASFDPQADPIVRIQAGRMRRALERFYHTDGLSSPLRIEVPKGSYMPAFVPNDTSSLEVSSRSAVEPQRTKPDLNRPSIGVVVFECLSEDKGQEHFATGITRQLLVDLSRFRNLSVVGPIYPDQLNAPSDRPSELGTQIGVRFVLQGGVQRQGDQLRVTVNLTDASTGESVWGKTYDRDVSAADLFELQDEIARRCAAFIGGDLGVITMALCRETQSKGPDELAAYEAALLCYHWGIVMTEDSFARALQALEKSVIESPRYALTKALLADIYCVDYHSNSGIVEDGIEKAEKLAQEAVDLDRECQDARWIRGQVHFYRHELDQCRRELACALELNPNNPHALATCGFYLPMLGEWDQGVALTERAIRLNPHHPGWYNFIPAFYHYRKGNIETAAEFAGRLDVPGLFWGPLLRAVVFAAAERPNDAGKDLAELLALQPHFAGEGRDVMKRFLITDENVSLLSSGLASAGLTLQ